MRYSCMGCKKRRPGCHDVCEDYANDVAKNEARKESIRKARREDDEYYRTIKPTKKNKKMR